jgi:hypothetical protein
MVNSGATVLFINKKYADSQKMWQVPLTQQIRLHNIDRTLNEAGSITHKVLLILQVGQDEEKFDFFVTSLGPEKVILGLPWLCHQNPAIDWQAGIMHLNTDQGLGPEPIEVEVTHIMANQMECCCLLAEKVLDTSQDDVFCLAGFTYSQAIAEKAIAAKRKKTFNEMVPIHYCDFAKYFQKKNLINSLSINLGITPLT